MRLPLIALLVALCSFGRAAAQDQVCENFEVDSPDCIAPCTGSPQINNMIVLDNGPGINHIEYETFTCSNPVKQSCSQNNLVQVSVINSWCDQGGGGGGGGCKDGDCPCDDGSCDGECCSDSRNHSSGATAKVRLPVSGGYYLNGELYDEPPIGFLRTTMPSKAARLPGSAAVSSREVCIPPGTTPIKTTGAAAGAPAPNALGQAETPSTKADSRRLVQHGTAVVNHSSDQVPLALRLPSE